MPGGQSRNSGFLVRVWINVEFSLGEVRRQEIQIRVPGPDDELGHITLAGEQFAGEPQGTADAVNAMEVATGSLDLTLLRRLARQYGRATADSLEQLLQKRPSR